MYKNEYVQGCGSCGQLTWFRKDLAKKSSEYSICQRCVDYKPTDKINNCGYANKIQELLDEWGIVAVVFECPYMASDKPDRWTCPNCAALNTNDNTLCSYCGEEGSDGHKS